jgi:hypothetical protein
MSMTYADADPAIASTDTVGRSADGVFVPRYAQTRRKKKPVRTWMIVAPIGALAVVGTAAALMMGGEGTAPSPAAPLETRQVAPSALDAIMPTPAPLVQATPATPAAPMQTSPARSAPSAPAVRTEQAAPRRAAPVTTDQPATRAETPVEPAGPRPYSASPTTVTASAAAPAIQTAPVQAPAIPVQPLN